jgi:hypothetical protein
MAQRSRTLTALLEVLSSIPSNHMVALSDGFFYSELGLAVTGLIPYFLKQNSTLLLREIDNEGYGFK